MEWKNKNLAEFVATVLGQNSSTTSLESLNSITSISISNLSRETGTRAYGFEELSLFPNLVTLIVRESILSNEDVQVLSKVLPSLKSIEFQDCLFEDDYSLSLLSSFQKLSFTGCFHKSFDFLKNLANLTSFSVEKPYNPITFDISLLEGLGNMKSLSFEKCKLDNQQKLREYCGRYTRLSLLDTTLTTVDFIDILPNGAELFIPSEYRQIDTVVRNSQRLVIRNDYRDYAYEEIDVKK